MNMMKYDFTLLLGDIHIDMDLKKLIDFTDSP